MLHQLPRRVVAPAVPCLAWLCLAGCGVPALPPDTVATLGDEEIRAADLASYVEAQVGAEADVLEDAVLSALLDQMIDERLLVRLARERELVEGGTGRREAVAALLAAEAPERPTEAEVAAAYREAVVDWRLPERVRLAQILVESRAKAERAAADLAQGEEFAAVARRYSEDPSAPFGGDQGQLSHADLPESFASAIFRLEPGETSPIIEAEYGFHIFRVVERLPGRTVPLDEAAGEIRERLVRERRARQLERLVAEAASRYTVRVLEDALPFEYRGAYGATDQDT